MTNQESRLKLVNIFKRSRSYEIQESRLQLPYYKDQETRVQLLTP